MLKVNNLVKNYDKTRAVKGIDFEIGKSEIVAILGPNGAGKSTTIKVLTGLIKPTKGKVEIFGKNYDESSDEIKNKLGYVPEESAMYEELKVVDYLLFFANIYGVSKETAMKRINKYLKKLDLVCEDKIISELSKGMKRKVLIIRSLINDPDILIYDEPASGLDPKTANFILEFMIEMKEQGKTILFSSHNLTHVEKIAEKVIILLEGKVIYNGKIDELKKRDGKKYILKYQINDEIKVQEFESEKFNEFIKQEGLKVLDVDVVEKSFEEMFLDLIK